MYQPPCDGAYGDLNSFGSGWSLILNNSVQLPVRNTGEDIILRWKMMIDSRDTDLRVYVKQGSADWVMVKSIRGPQDLDGYYNYPVGEVNVSAYAGSSIYIKFAGVPRTESQRTATAVVSDFSLRLRS